MASVGTAIERLFPAEKSNGESLTTDMLGWLLPFAYFLSLGVIQHAVLRVLRSQRRLRDSCAMSLYAGGGPAMALLLLALVLFVIAHQLGWSIDYQWHDLAWSWRARLLTVFSGLSLIVFFATLGVAQARLHQSRPWKVSIASIVALIVSGFFFGTFHPPGAYGMHLSLAFRHLPERWSIDISLGT
jgi:hypothetical protein